MVKIGDKVRFLNAVGGGIVRQIINKELVSVEEEDGFETPVRMNEVVVIASAGEVTAEIKGHSEKTVLNFDSEKPVRVKESKDGNELNVYLAFLPEDVRSLDKSRIDCYIVNDCNYWLMFTYLSQTGSQWMVRYAGMAEPNQKLHLENFGKEDLNELENLCVQFVAFKRDKSFEQQMPVSVEIRLDTVKFYKLHSFVENDYFTEKALLYPVVKKGVAQQSVKVSHMELEKALKEKLHVDVIPVKAAKPTIIRNGVVEIDLHINSLLDTTAGMDSASMLNYQMDVFREALAQYKNKKGTRIVFIHGKGDGVLRKSILKELTTRYKSYLYQDASFREYGYGATMVTIR